MQLSGYSDEEKLEIANRYLWPRRLKEAGLESKPLTLEEQVIPHIIKRYTREAGVRQLEQMLGRLTRKVALKLAEHSPDQPEAQTQSASPVSSAQLPKAPQSRAAVAQVGRQLPSSSWS